MRDEVTVLVAGEYHPRALERLEGAFRLERIERSDAGLVTPALAARVRGLAASNDVEPAFLEALPALEIVASFGVGYENIDARHAASRGVVVTHTPDVLTEEVADTAVALLLNAVRGFPAAERWLRQGRWPIEESYPLSPLSLRGRRVGIFGMGRIGLAVARRLEAFGLPIAYHNRRHLPDLGYDYHPTLLGLAKEVDTLVSIAPGGAETRHAVDAAVLRALGPQGVFVNIGRGSTVDQQALVEALRDGTIAAAGLDVFEDEPHVPDDLLALDNATLLPHVGSASVATRIAMADLVADNLIAWFGEGRALTPVPETAHLRQRTARGGT